MLVRKPLMLLDLGALETSMVVTGGAAFTAQINAGGAALDAAAASGDAAALSTAKAGEAMTATAKATKATADAQAIASQQTAIYNQYLYDEAHAHEKVQRGVKKTGELFLGLGIAAVASVALTVAAYAGFDKEMSTVQAETGATAAQMVKLDKAAVDAGNSTAFSATEAGTAISYLAANGLTATQIVSGLKGVLDLADVANISLADSSSIAATAMADFNLPASQTPHIADLLAAGANKARGSVTDLAAGIKTVGVLAGNSNQTLDETVGTLTAFASKGLLGANAGTALRTSLLNLEKPSSAATSTMTKYGISVHDASGNMLPFSEIAGQLHDKLGGLDAQTRQTALATIFSNRAVQAATILYNEGSKGIDSWIKKVNDSGYAEQIAAQKLNNLSGDLHFLKDAFDGAFINSGSGANLVIRNLVQNTTEFVKEIGSLPPGVIGAGTAIVGVAGAGLLVLGMIFKAVPAIREFKEAFMALGAAGKASAIGVGVAAIAALALVAALVLITQANADAAAKTQAYGDTLDSVTGKTTTATRALREQNLATNVQYLGFIDSGRSAIQIAQQYGISLKTVTAAAGGNRDALKQINGYLDVNNQLTGTGLKVADAAHASAFTRASDLRDLKEAVDKEAAGIKGATVAQQAKQAADVAAAQSSSDLAIGLQADSASANDATGAIKGLAQELTDFGNGELTARAAARAAQQAVDDATTSLKKNGRTLDINTAAGRENQAALDSIAQTANAAAAAQYNLTGNVADTTAGLDAAQAAFITTAEHMGLNESAARSLAAQLLATPSEITSEIKVTGVPESAAQIAAFRKALGTIGIFQSTSYVAQQLKSAQGAQPGQLLGNPLKIGLSQNANGSITHYAGGGLPGTSSQVAQIKRAGDVTVWAEDETDGESFIPWAQSKRGRSTAILQQTAQAFGYALVPVGAPSTTAGPSTGASPASSSGGMKISGKLDLGNGLIGYVQGVIENVLNDVATDSAGGRAQ